MKKTNNIVKAFLSAFALTLVLSACSGHGQVCDAYASNDSADSQKVESSAAEMGAMAFAATQE